MWKWNVCTFLMLLLSPAIAANVRHGTLAFHAVVKWFGGKGIISSVCDKIVESERDRHTCNGERGSAKERETVREGNFHKWYSSMSIKYVRRLIEFVGNAQHKHKHKPWKSDSKSSRNVRHKKQKYLNLSCATSTYAENKRTKKAKLILSFSVRANFGEQKCSLIRLANDTLCIYTDKAI